MKLFRFIKNKKYCLGLVESTLHPIGFYHQEIPEIIPLDLVINQQFVDILHNTLKKHSVDCMQTQSNAKYLQNGYLHINDERVFTAWGRFF